MVSSQEVWLGLGAALRVAGMGCNGGFCGLDWHGGCALASRQAFRPLDCGDNSPGGCLDYHLPREGREAALALGKGLAFDHDRAAFSWKSPEPPLALFRRRCAMARQAVPLSRFTSRVGGGSAFYIQADMNTRLLATVFRWIARIIGTVLVGLALILAMGEGVPNLFTQPFLIQLGFLALALALSGILLAWRWEFPGGIISLVGWVLFIVAEKVHWRHSLFFILLAVPSLLFLGSSFLRRYYENHKPAA